MESRMLFDQQPLVVNPTLAAAIGLNEAIILQQIHYWIRESKKEHDGRKWTYNSYREWQIQFPFWSIDTIKRTFARLETMGLVISGSFNRAKFDKTKWYTINYDMMDMHQSMSANCTDREMQNAHTESGKMHQPIPKNITETHAEISVSPSNDGYKEFQKIKQKLKDKL